MHLVNVAVRSAVAGCMVVAAACDGRGGGIDTGVGIGGAAANSPVCLAVGPPDDFSATPTPPAAFGDAAAGFDGSLATYATLSPGAGASGTLSGNGVSRMGGEVAGIAFTDPPGTGTISVTITTYAGGVPADSADAGTMTFTPEGHSDLCPTEHCFSRNGFVFMGIETTQDFDGIEASISISNFTSPLEVRELCVY